MADTKAEIARVEKALAETKSPYLKRDYEKYLRKLRKRLKSEVRWMANKKNLIPQAHTLTVEEASKGGKNSVEARRNKKILRDCLEIYLENEITGKVLSYNTKTGKLEKDDICGHLKNGIDVNQKENTHQWYEIELEDGRKIKLTGNHKVYLPDLNCYRRVDELQGDENLLVI